MGSVFAMQGFGQLGGALVALCAIAGFKDSLSTAVSYAKCSGVCGLAVDKIWRVLIGKFLCRLQDPLQLTNFKEWVLCPPASLCTIVSPSPKLLVTPSMSLVISRKPVGMSLRISTARVAEPLTSCPVQRLWPKEISLRSRRLLGLTLSLSTPSGRTERSCSARLVHGFCLMWLFMVRNLWEKIPAGCSKVQWKLTGYCHIGLGLNSSTVLTAIGFAGGPTVYKQLYHLAAGNAILICAGAIPGYWMSVLTVDTIGRKPIQLVGFCLLTILFIIWGFAFDKLGNKGMFGIYVVVQFFFNFGMTPCLYALLMIILTYLQDQTQQPSSSPVNASQPATAPPPTASLPLPAKSAPSLPKQPSLPSVPVTKLARPARHHGSTTSCKFTLLSCSRVFLPLC